MSSTTLPVMTADQPAHALSNIVDHPGSSYAGLGVAIATIGSFMSANAYPTTLIGWLTYAAALASAVFAALGK